MKADATLCEEDVALLEADALRICADLIRSDSSNVPDGSGPGERAAAEYVMRELEDVGYRPTYLESAPRRANVLLRVPGTDARADALAVHGHLDTVPAVAADWRVDPFCGDVLDDCLWGRGAVDMKATIAMVIACLRSMATRAAPPSQDLAVAFFADEEALSLLGSQWVVDHHADHFDGVGTAVGEVGGFNVWVQDRHRAAQRVYLVQTAEKGTLWLRLRARGRAGHGSMRHDDNAVIRLAEALVRLRRHEWPRRYLDSVLALLGDLSDLTGVPFEPDHPEPLLDRMGGVREVVAATLSDTVNATMLSAGYAPNVVPQDADAWLDCRFLPGHEDELLAKIIEIVGPQVEVQVERTDIALESPWHHPLVDRMSSALRHEDPQARVMPYCQSGGTDNAALARLGITGYGFAPLRLPPDLEFGRLFHGVDERVPVDAVRFGARVMARFLQSR